MLTRRLFAMLALCAATACAPEVTFVGEEIDPADDPGALPPPAEEWSEQGNEAAPPAQQPPPAEQPPPTDEPHEAEPPHEAESPPEEDGFEDDEGFEDDGAPEDEGFEDESAPEPTPEPEEPPPPPEPDPLTFACGLVEDVDCSEPDDNRLRECIEACEEMSECLGELCMPDVADHYAAGQVVDACVLACRRGVDFADPDDIEDLDCDEMQPALCDSMPNLGAACGCADPDPQPEPGPQPEPEPQPDPDPQPDPEPQPQPDPQPEPDPEPPAVDCEVSCTEMLTCLGDICSEGTLDSFGGTIRGRCLETCNADPARFAGRQGAACAEVNAEVCAEEPTLGFVCSC